MDKRDSTESAEGRIVPRTPTGGGMYRRAEMRAYAESVGVSDTIAPAFERTDGADTSAPPFELTAGTNASAPPFELAVGADEFAPSYEETMEADDALTLPLEPTTDRDGVAAPGPAHFPARRARRSTLRRRRIVTAMVALAIGAAVWLARRPDAPTGDGAAEQSSTTAGPITPPLVIPPPSQQTVAPAAAVPGPATPPAAVSEPTTPTAARPPAARRAGEPRLVVTSEPAGARVTVNGIGWGNTPVNVRYLPPGAKRIRVTRDGYLSQERVVMVTEEGATVRVQIALRRRAVTGTSSSATARPR